MRIPVLVAVYFHATCLSKVTMDNGLTQITIRTLGWLKILSLKKFIQVINTFQKYYLEFVLYKKFIAQKIIFLWKKYFFNHQIKEDTFSLVHFCCDPDFQFVCACWSFAFVQCTLTTRSVCVYACADHICARQSFLASL